MKTADAITAHQWRMGHPEFLGSLPSDFSYAKICTGLLRKVASVFKRYDVPSTGNVDFALRLGHYVEDIVSNTHVFDSFRKIHMAMYGKKLPFYEIPYDYLDDDVNIEDLKFMIWDHVQQLREDNAIINPDNVAIDNIAQELFPEVCDAYELAPEVVELHYCIFDPANYTDFIASKKILMWLLLTNRLTAYPGLIDRITEGVKTLLEKEYIDLDVSHAFYFLLSQHLFETPCKLMSLFVNELLSQMLESEGMVTEAKRLKDLRRTGMRNFKCKSRDDETMLLVDTKTHDEYRLSLESFIEPVETDRMYILTDLASFDGELWEINGSSWFSTKPDEKPVPERDGEHAYKYYLKSFKGERIAYFKDFNEMRNRIVGNVPLTADEGMLSDFEDGEPVVAFINTNGSLSLSPALASTIPDPKNPYFKEMDKGLLLSAALNPSLASTEMVGYLFEKGWYDGVGLSSSISAERGNELFHDNFDFFMRYFRGAEYHTS